MKALGIWSVCLTVLACQPRPSSDLFAEGEALGKLDKKLSEVSGLAASRKNKDLLWVHNDSRNDAELFLIDLKGNLQCTYELRGIKNRDWEDISIGPGPVPGQHYLYIGDIGDNEARYPFKYIYRLVEPQFEGERKKVVLNDFDTLMLRLPLGAQDTEALAVEPQTGDLYLFSKRLQKNLVYRLQAADLVPLDTLIFSQVAEIPFYNIVAADFSSDGRELLVKTYNEVLYWKKADEESWLDALARPAMLLSYKPEPQGESVGWAAEGNGYFTTSEFRDGKSEPLIFYKRN